MDFAGPDAIDKAIEAGLDLDGSPIPVKIEKGGDFAVSAAFLHGVRAWGPPGPPWGLLGPPGASLGLVGPSGGSWGLLGSFGVVWDLLGPPGASWGLLGPPRAS